MGNIGVMIGGRKVEARQPWRGEKRRFGIEG